MNSSSAVSEEQMTKQHSLARGRETKALRSETASAAASCFVAGMLLFVGASAACALATNVGFLIAARAVQGAGAAIIAPVSLAILSAAFPPEKRGQALDCSAASQVWPWSADR